MKKLFALLIVSAIIAAPARAEEPLGLNPFGLTGEEFGELLKLTNAGIMMGIEGAGYSRLVSNCVWRVYLTTDLAEHQVAIPGSKSARHVPKNMEEYLWTLRDIQRALPRYITKCEEWLNGEGK